MLCAMPLGAASDLIAGMLIAQLAIAAVYVCYALLTVAYCGAQMLLVDVRSGIVKACLSNKQTTVDAVPPLGPSSKLLAQCNAACLSCNVAKVLPAAKPFCWHLQGQLRLKRSACLAGLLAHLQHCLQICGWTYRGF